MKTQTHWLALDVGGANLKAAHSQEIVRSLPFALWRDPGSLASRLKTLVEGFPPFDAVALTTTAELCDCFETKTQGVLSILDSVEQAFPTKALKVWCTNGRFLSSREVRDRPVLAAAANWLALATCVARKIGPEPAILIDIGSTTTDLVPLINGEVLARGRTDTERLQTCELVYAGVRRTPLCALATSLPFRSRQTGLAAELFATTLDVFLMLGDLAENFEDHETADGRPATRVAARARLARMIGADCDHFSWEDAVAFAEECQKSLLDRLACATHVMIETLSTKVTLAVLSGTGEFLARRLVERVFGGKLRVTRLSDIWGAPASEVGCARALLALVEQESALS